jgi:hypothetical protein
MKGSFPTILFALGVSILQAILRRFPKRQKLPFFDGEI